ncbi:MAG TPA: chloride channel protein, partial [Bdellovibrio sp.]
AAICNGLIIISYGELFKSFEHITRSLLKTNPLALLCITPILFLTAWYINTKKFPFSGGSGIPQILAATEVPMETPKGNAFIRGVLSIRSAVAKIVGSLLVVLGGGAIGREGPSLHVSASIFFLFHRVLNRIHKTLEYRAWIITGAAAGLAAAFNTPLGGIVYAVEELGSQYFTRVKNNLLLAVIVSGIASQALLGSYLFIGSPTTNAYDMKLLLIVVVMASICGLAGAIFGHAIYFATKIRKKIRSKKLQIIFVMVLSIVIFSIAYYDNFAIGGGKEYISSLLFTDIQQSATTIPLRFLNTFFVYITGVAGGIFAPSLALGAGIGYQLGQFLEVMFNLSNSNLFILCGMVSFLTGVTRTPLTSFILVMEMTDRHASIVPLMLSGFISILIAKLWHKEGFYELAVNDYVNTVRD